jgi:hypothetical protein
VAKLRAEVADVREAIKEESDNTTKSLLSIYKRLGITSDCMTTLIYKVMPEHAETRERLDSILGLTAPRARPDKPS